MAGFSDAWELAILQLLFNATNFANVADNAASSPLTNLYVGLHTADPTDSGNQSGSEATYTGYARKAVARTSGGWTCATSSGTTTVKNAAAVTFDPCTAGSNTNTHVSIGVGSSGATALIAAGALSASLAVSAGITPAFAINALSFALD